MDPPSIEYLAGYCQFSPADSEDSIKTGGSLILFRSTRQIRGIGRLSGSKVFFLLPRARAGYVIHIPGSRLTSHLSSLDSPRRRTIAGNPLFPLFPLFPSPSIHSHFDPGNGLAGTDASFQTFRQLLRGSLDPRSLSFPSSHQHTHILSLSS